MWGSFGVWVGARGAWGVWVVLGKRSKEVLMKGCFVKVGCRKGE